MSRSPLPVVATTRHRRRHALLRHRRRCSDSPPRERLVGVHHLPAGVRVPHGHLAVRLGEVRDGRAGRQGRHGLHVGRLEGRVRRGSGHHERRGRGGVHRVHRQTHVTSPVTADARPAGVGLHTRLLGVRVPRGEVVMRSLLLPLRLAVFFYVSRHSRNRTFFVHLAQLRRRGILQLVQNASTPQAAHRFRTRSCRCSGAGVSTRQNARRASPSRTRRRSSVPTPHAAHQFRTRSSSPALKRRRR